MCDNSGKMGSKSVPHVEEPFSRVGLLFGPAALPRLADSAILVVGLGAVGSFAVEALARSGVGTLYLADADVVEPSNINRQLYALATTIGAAKATLAAARVAEIAPACRVKPFAEFVTAEKLPRFMALKPDLVVDAIDIMRDKVSLICAALSQGIPVVSSMGAARRYDATKVRVGALAEVTGCPLAKRLRRELRHAPGCSEAMIEPLRCVYSTEKVEPTPHLSGTLQLAKPRVMGSLVSVTGTFGLVAAGEALRLLLSPAE